MNLSNAELIASLRKAGSIWFRNSDLLLLEEAIRRWDLAENRLYRIDNEPEHAVEENTDEHK